MNGKLISKRESDENQREVDGHDGKSNTRVVSYLERRKYRGTHQAACERAFYAVADCRTKQ